MRCWRHINECQITTVFETKFAVVEVQRGNRKVPKVLSLAKPSRSVFYLVMKMLSSSYLIYQTMWDKLLEVKTQLIPKNVWLIARRCKNLLYQGNAGNWINWTRKLSKLWWRYKDESSGMQFQFVRRPAP